MGRVATAGVEAGGMSTPFRIEQLDGAVTLHGELDSSVTGDLVAMFDRVDGQPLVVDLSGLEFMDSSGIHVLYVAKVAHPQVRFVNPSTPVRRVLEITGTDALILSD
jgi:anti-anti-sigma factor